MNYETYENLLRVLTKRKRQASLRGDLSTVLDVCNEINLLQSSFELCNKTEKNIKNNETK